MSDSNHELSLIESDRTLSLTVIVYCHCFSVVDINIQFNNIFFYCITNNLIYGSTWDFYGSTCSNKTRIRNNNIQTFHGIGRKRKIKREKNEEMDMEKEKEKEIKNNNNNKGIEVFEFLI